MKLLLNVISVLFLFALPLILVNLTKKVKILKTIGAITLCFAAGFIYSMLPINYDKKLFETLSSVLVAISIPLTLFSFDILSIKKLAKSTIISFSLLIVSSIAVTVLVSYGFFAYTKDLKSASALAGMASAVYIGGTPNLFAVGKALLGEDAAIINLANILESLFGGLFFFAMISVLKIFYHKFLTKKDTGLENNDEINDISKQTDTEYDYSLLPKTKKETKQTILVCLLAVVCLGLGAGLEILINGNMSGSLYIMIVVSVLGIAFSFIKPIRETKGIYQISQYLILVFSLGLAMAVDFSSLASEVLPIFIFFVADELLISIVHFVLCKIFNIDGGTAIITLVAGLYSPPFIAPVANAYDDRNLIVPGVICGIFGFIIANLIGIGIGTLFVTLI